MPSQEDSKARDAENKEVRELSFLMLGTGVEEFLRQMENFTYPIQYYLNPHFEMLEIFDTQ